MVDYNNDKIVSNAAHQFFACWRETYSHYLQYLQGVHVFKTVGRKFANLEISEISMQKRRFINLKIYNYNYFFFIRAFKGEEHNDIKN